MSTGRLHRGRYGFDSRHLHMETERPSSPSYEEFFDDEDRPEVLPGQESILPEDDEPEGEA